MPKTKIYLAKDNIDRLYGVAFWLWEYQRRNKHYIHFSNVIEYYLEYFEKIGVAKYIYSKEFYDEMFSYFYSKEDGSDIHEHPFVKRLIEEHGEVDMKMFIKFSFLGEAFRKRFFRIYKHYSIGIDTNEVVDKLLSCKNNEKCLKKILESFRSKDADDVSALLKANDKWSIKIDGDDPNWYNNDIEKSGLITIDPVSVKKNAGKIGQEINALKLVDVTLKNLFGTETIQEDVLGDVYNLCIKSSNIIPSDFTRLQLLWVFDNARINGYDDPLPFYEVHKKLSQQVRLLAYNEQIWSQFIDKKYRIKEYYDRMCFKIDSMNPLRLCKNKSNPLTLKEIFAL